MLQILSQKKNYKFYYISLKTDLSPYTKKKKKKKIIY